MSFPPLTDLFGYASSGRIDQSDVEKWAKDVAYTCIGWIFQSKYAARICKEAWTGGIQI